MKPVHRLSPALQRISELRTAGNSQRAIAQILEAEGVSPPPPEKCSFHPVLLPDEICAPGKQKSGAAVQGRRPSGGCGDGPRPRASPRGLHPNSVRAIIQHRAGAAGVQGRVSGHSLRVRAAQSLAAAGAGTAEMQVAGRWKSATMPAHYAAGELAGRGAVARYRYGRAPH